MATCTSLYVTNTSQIWLILHIALVHTKVSPIIKPIIPTNPYMLLHVATTPKISAKDKPPLGLKMCGVFNGSISKVINCIVT